MEFKRALDIARFNLILRRENLSLAGYSSAESVSVSVLHCQNSSSLTKFTTCQNHSIYPFYISYISSGLTVITGEDISARGASGFDR